MPTEQCREKGLLGAKETIEIRVGFGGEGVLFRQPARPSEKTGVEAPPGRAKGYTWTRSRAIIRGIGRTGDAASLTVSGMSAKR